MTTPAHPLLWTESRDPHGNTRMEAISLTYGDADHKPSFCWRLHCALRNDEAVWLIDATDREILPDPGTDDPPASFGNADTAKRWCQSHEDELRGVLGSNLPPYVPKAEEAPAVRDEHGFVPTTKVTAKWSKNGGVLRMYRVWKQPDGPLEQEREILDQPELDVAIAGYVKQKLIEDCVTRLVTGGFGRLMLDSPAVTAVMQVELDWHGISHASAVVRRAGKTVELPLSTPTEAEVHECIARQMAARQADLDEKVGSVPMAELHRQIERSARALGISYEPPKMDTGPAPEGGNILPITLEDIQAGGGDIANPGQRKKGEETR